MPVTEDRDRDGQAVATAESFAHVRSKQTVD
jgi:hypothetical protein